MNKLVGIFLLLLFTPKHLFAQITPKENSSLNYRIIGFSFPGKSKTINYKVQIASGNCNDEYTFEQNIVTTVAGKKNKIIAEVPSFGKQYTWRIVYVDNKSKTTQSELYHFSTMMSPNVDQDSVRMRITGNSGEYKDHYVFVDGNKVLYDMKGKPVWFFPQIDGLDPDSMHLRDMRISSFGTITVIIDERIYEINYNGDILWKGPGNGKAKKDILNFDNAYHHELIKLPNGHFMVMGFEQSLWQLPAPVDSATFAQLSDKLVRDSNNVFFQKMFFSTILEYNKQGDIVWKWSGSDYFRRSDLFKRMVNDEFYDLNDTHANAFYFDQKKQNIYISFRDISRITKIQYPTGKVLATYGKRYFPGSDRRMKNGLFCYQHSCRVSQDGYLYMFNNNSCHSRALPTIVMLKEPTSEKDSMKKIWEFECPMEELGPNETTQGYFNFGGNVSEMPDSAFFVCMGGLYGKVFIVNRDKKILWSGQPEKWDKTTSKWTKEGVLLDAGMREGSYRASVIDRGELEKMVWSEPLD